jgi:heptosyltransferase III
MTAHAPRATPGGHTLVARLDSDGDVLLAGPAVRAVARGSDAVTLLVSPAGEQAARLLPGVDDVLVWPCPWSGYAPPPVEAADVDRLVATLRDAAIDQAVVMTSYHQSSLPMALLLRLAGVGRIIATSEDYPGSLLDVRHPAGGPHEVQRGLSLVAAAGFSAADDGRLRLRTPLPGPPAEVGSWARGQGGFVAVHPTASVPARACSPDHLGRIVAALRSAGHAVLLTGTDADCAVAEHVRRCADEMVGSDAGPVLDLTGRTTFAELAAVLRLADCLVCGNTGPAHLAVAVGTPVVSLFSPVVDVAAWHPWGVPCVVLGDQQAPCAGTRARTCPVAGHPCLDGINPDAVARAVERLTVQATPSPQRARPTPTQTTPSPQGARPTPTQTTPSPQDVRPTPTQATPSPQRARLALVGDGPEGGSA